MKRQCELLGVNRTSIYYSPVVSSEDEREREEAIKARLDYWHTKFCYMGARKLRDKLEREDGVTIGRKRVRRYMEEMGLYAVYPKPRLSKPGPEHHQFPYLLRGLVIGWPNHVWAIDITYIAICRRHMYLTAIIDWYSRYLVGWALSDTLETAPVLDAARDAIERHGCPGIINSDQGGQFTSKEYVSLLASLKIRQSMDGKARWVDNVMIERWFRSLKVENIYQTEYLTPRELRCGIAAYVAEYNDERPHQGLGYARPREVYLGKTAA